MIINYLPKRSDNLGQHHCTVYIHILHVFNLILQPNECMDEPDSEECYCVFLVQKQKQDKTNRKESRWQKESCSQIKVLSSFFGRKVTS